MVIAPLAGSRFRPAHVSQERQHRRPVNKQTNKHDGEEDDDDPPPTVKEFLEEDAHRFRCLSFSTDEDFYPLEVLLAKGTKDGACGSSNRSELYYSEETLTHDIQLLESNIESTDKLCRCPVDFTCSLDPSEDPQKREIALPLLLWLFKVLGSIDESGALSVTTTTSKDPPSFPVKAITEYYHQKTHESEPNRIDDSIL